MNISPINFKQTQTPKTQTPNQEAVEAYKEKFRKQDKKRDVIIAAAASAAVPAAFFVRGIGRNPVKAAKFLRGNQVIRKKAYHEAFKLLDEVLNKTGEFKTKLSDINIRQFIKDCPKEMLPKDNTYYHGTWNSKNIYKQGFSPFASGQLPLFSREVGAGVYLTPNEKVAYNFKAVTGKIIPVKVEDAKIATIDPDDLLKVYGKVTPYLTERCEVPLFGKGRTRFNAMQELFVRKMFTDLGYDGVYLPKAITHVPDSGTRMPDTNRIFGIDQSQLVLFNPEKLEIQSRNMKERFFDIGRGIKAQMKQYVNTFSEQKRLMKELLGKKS